VSKRQTYILAALLGIFLGVAVPLAAWHWPAPQQAAVAGAVSVPESQTTEYYHFVVDHGTMAVVTGKRDDNGAVVIRGLDISAWPASARETAVKAEFRSLDEVQSFIDSVDESLWLE